MRHFSIQSKGSRECARSERLCSSLCWFIHYFVLYVVVAAGIWRYPDMLWAYRLLHSVRCLFVSDSSAADGFGKGLVPFFKNTGIECLFVFVLWLSNLLTFSNMLLTPIRTECLTIHWQRDECSPTPKRMTLMNRFFWVSHKRVVRFPRWFLRTGSF